MINKQDNDSVEYWNDFYKKKADTIPHEPSSFAKSVLNILASTNYQPVIELGVGNGRDALFFSHFDVNVIGVDLSTSAIEKLQAKSDSKDNIRFIIGDFSRLPTPFYFSEFGCIYSRFTLHSVNAEAASRTLRWAFQNLRNKGILLIEARSVLDDLYGKGTPVNNEKDAFINTHYRRFLRKSELIDELKQIGFRILFEQEEKGLSVAPGDDPVLIRLHAEKP